MTKYDVLQKYFGYSEFRKGQEEVVDAILQTRDTLAVMPTGAGKSVCFQVPAMIFDGITLVISPLISLMRDQVLGLVEDGVPAAFINTELSFAQSTRVFENARKGEYKIIYVAPERLDNQYFIDFARNTKISMVAIDEAHCISHWGNDFRPSYLKICDFLKSLPTRPVISAFTATATQDVKQDIAEILQLHDPLILTTGFNRENLHFDVKRPKNKYDELRQLLEDNQEKCSVIYCSTRKFVEDICEKLQADGFDATRYHAGLNNDERKRNQDDFIYDRKRIIVATNAFGMGIDKSDVSLVVHYNMPKNIESYYQEAGRAGRDGNPANCVLYFSPLDIITIKRFIEMTGENNPELSPQEIEAIQKRDRERLNEMVNYCKTTKCFREFILNYFDDEEDVKCSNCGNCENKNPIEEKDITIEAQKILSCVSRMDQRFGLTRVIEVLRGGKSEKVLEFGFDKLSTYGIMKDCSEKDLRDICTFLIDNEYLQQTVDKFPVIKLTEKSNEILRAKKQIMMPFRKDMVTATKEKRREKREAKEKGQIEYHGINKNLYDALKKLRNEIASEAKLPAYVIFHNTTLIEMCKRMPKNEKEFLQISGVGQRKFDKYGAAFLNCLAEFG